MGECSENQQTSRTLRYVACVSYPRSGHHLTQRVLSDYFQQDFRYCQYGIKTHEDCCQAYPCTHPMVTMTKNHDQELDRPNTKGIAKISGLPYLVLIRNYLEATVSDYSLYLRENPDSKKAWIFFSKYRAKYYQRFVQKWIFSKDSLEKLIIRYEDLTDNPVFVYNQIIAYFHSSWPIDQMRLEQVIKGASLENQTSHGAELIPGFGVHNRRRLEDFKYFDTKHFALLEVLLSKELAELGYENRFARKPYKLTLFGHQYRIPQFPGIPWKAPVQPRE